MTKFVLDRFCQGLFIPLAEARGIFFEVENMQVRPDFREVKELSESGKYNIIPVSAEILSDFITPIEALRILKNISSHCFLLESAKESEFWGRYTFLGFDPKMEITLKDGVLKTGNIQIETGDPSFYIRQILDGYRSAGFDYLPPFTGGLMGYFSFEFFHYVEPTIRKNLKDDFGFNDMDLMLFDRLIAFDHLRQKIVLIVNMKTDDPYTGYNKAVYEIRQMADLLRNGAKKKEIPGRITGEIEAQFTKEEFEEMVRKAQKHIHEGDIFQIVLSNRLRAPFEGSLLNTYRQLRTINPSPYMFYLSGNHIEIAGASPETLVKLENGTLHTFPLAGTRPRGKDRIEDEKLKEELLQDEKELAEHDMLVDLGRNDLGRISEFGSVKVENLHDITKFSHVMHIGSTVKGTIRKELDALDAVESVLPAGTLSGAPKIRACDLIGSLEGIKRGVYGGGIGYIDFAGNMETCIGIRILFKQNGMVFIQSGAGIVADSDPAAEYQETINKARASLRALEQGLEEES